MGVSERRDRQRSELRVKIVKAARDIVADSGFEALTIRKIAEAVEYSPGAIYLHFASRDEIAFELVRVGYGALLRYLRPPANVVDPQERLMTIEAGYLAFANAEPQWYRLIFMEDQRYAQIALGSANGRNRPDDAFGVLVAACADLIERGVYRAMDPHSAALVIWSGLHGLASLALTVPDFTTIADSASAMIETLDRGLLA